MFFCINAVNRETYN